jgi:drug/metabolite transporter (DMT)-like permease
MRASRSRAGAMKTSTLPGQSGAPVPVRGWTEIALLLMVVVWGVNFSVVKRALEAFSPLGFNGLRFLIASLIVWAILRSRGPLRFPERGDLPRLVLLGVVGNVAYQLCFILGLDRTQAGNASLMLALTPVFTAFLSSRLGHERLARRAWLGAGLSVVGVGLVSGASLRHLGTLETLAGDLILVAAAAIWSLYTVGSQPLIARYGSIEVTVWTLWAGGVVLFLIGLPSLARQDWGEVGVPEWGGLVFSACFAIALAYLIWYRGVERIGNARTAAFSNLTPVVALLVGLLWLGEAVTLLSVAGAGLTLTGVMLVRAAPGPAR